jgi:hypothetical protein
MSDRWGRLAPLTGVLFGLMMVAAVIANSSEAPKASASPAQVVVRYAKHRSEIETSAILFALAFLVLVLFAGSLRSYLRRAAAAEGFSALVLAGAILMAAGALSISGVEYGIAHNLGNLTPEMTKTLNFVANELFLPLIGGGFVFGVGAGIAIVRGAALPNWLGWVAIVIGICALIPPVSFPSLLAFLLWTVVTAILVYQRSSSDKAASAPVPQPA